MPSTISVFYFVFVILYYAETQKQASLQRERDMLDTQFRLAQAEFSSLRQLQQNAAAYRHDMENAIYACENIADNNKRYIKLRMYPKNNKLCIDIRNSYQTEPIFHQGLPILKEQGHGFSTKSMVHIYRKAWWYMPVSVKDGWFIFQATV